MAAEIFMASPDDVDRIWPGRVAKMVEQAYTFADEIMPPDMVDLLRLRHRQLWIVWDGAQIIAAGVTKIILARSGKACLVTAAGGKDLPEWTHVISTIEDFARREGCKRVIIEGRPGWERLFKAYRRTRVVIEREV